MSSLPVLRVSRAKGRSVFVIAGSACFVVISLVITYDGLSSHSFGLWALLFSIVGPIGVIVFGFFGVLGVRMMGRPALGVDDQGIWDNTSGLSIGHISPEAASGGAIGLVRERDRIVIDIPSRTISLAIDDAELDRRRKERGPLPWRPVSRVREVSKALQAYASMAASADKGAVRIVRE